MNAQPLDPPRPVVLAHGSLRHASIADLATATAIVADSGRPNGGLNVDVCHQTRGRWPLPALRALAPDNRAGVGRGPVRRERPATARDRGRALATATRSVLRATGVSGTGRDRWTSE